MSSWHGDLLRDGLHRASPVGFSFSFKVLLVGEDGPEALLLDDGSEFGFWSVEPLDPDGAPPADEGEEGPEDSGDQEGNQKGAPSSPRLHPVHSIPPSFTALMYLFPFSRQMRMGRNPNRYRRDPRTGDPPRERMASQRAIESPLPPMSRVVSVAVPWASMSGDASRAAMQPAPLPSVRVVPARAIPIRIARAVFTLGLIGPVLVDPLPGLREKLNGG